jgi:cephalosporin hydroxylase
MILHIDTDAGFVEVETNGDRRVVPLTDPEAFALISKAWLRAGWDAKYVYKFTWLGRPIIQLPEDIVRLQEVIYRVRPDVIVETGVAHGGSLVFFASLCEAMGAGRVVGVDIEVRHHNRSEIEAHRLFPRISLVEGNSTNAETFARVRELVGDAERVFVLLDSNHSMHHVLDELTLYSSLVSVDSYLVVEDGIMRDFTGAPRTTADWAWDNPLSAVEQFLSEHDEFVRERPEPVFNEGFVRDDVTYWPGGWLRRIR